MTAQQDAPYGSIALQTLRELHRKFTESADQAQLGNEAQMDWESALRKAGFALLSAAEENERLRALIRMIACNHDAEWGRQLARHHLKMETSRPIPLRRPSNPAPVG
jgi:hypothetical protein